MRIANSASQLAPGVDVLGEGGMFVAPPTVRDDRVYQWEDYNAGAAELPAAWIEALRELQETRAPDSNGERDDEPVDPDELTAALVALPMRMWIGRSGIASACRASVMVTPMPASKLLTRGRRSRPEQCYQDERKWNAFRRSPPKDITARTILWMADEEAPGWRDDYAAQGIESFGAARAEVSNEEYTPIDRAKDDSAPVKKEETVKPKSEPLSRQHSSIGG